MSTNLDNISCRARDSVSRPCPCGAAVQKIQERKLHAPARAIGLRSESFARITKRTSKFFPWVSFLSLFFLFDGKWLSLRLKSPAACFTRFGEISGELVENFRRAYGSVREPPTRVPYEKPSTGSLFYLPAFAGGEQDLGALVSPAGSVGAGRLPPANCAPNPASLLKKA